jgi:erythronate-4-phosphate dehydrogenase
MKKRVLADENIPCLDWLTAEGFDVHKKNGREITAADLDSIDILLVRSVTRVDSTLLENAQVAFVGSCTIGTDHIDLAMLKSKGIPFANAPGCNANAVVDYVLTSMLTQFDLHQLRTKRVGIVGSGQVGSRLNHRLSQIGIKTCVFDPYVDTAIDTFNDVLESDVVSLHVPLTHHDDYPTHHLIDDSALNLMKDDAMLINTSRGNVIDEDALKRILNEKTMRVVLDVFDGEPLPDSELLSKLTLKTPHIAGYSVQGKIRGSLQVFESLYHCLDKPFKIPSFLEETQSVMPEYPLPELLDEVFDIRGLSKDFYTAFVSQFSSEEKSACFDRFRKLSATRNEWGSIRIQCQHEKQQALLHQLGFLCPN